MRIIIFLFLLIVFFSCVYTPSEIEQNNLTPIDSAYIFLNLDNNGDTIPVAYSKDLYYAFDIGEKDLYQVVLSLNEDIIYESAELSGIIEIDINNFETGYYDLKIEIYTHTGSGSLADKVGIEMLYGSFEYVLVFDKDPPHEIQITNIYNEDGLLKIEWEKYDRINFSYYFLDGAGVRVQLKDPDETFFYDSTFIGGQASYSIGVGTTNDQQSLSQPKEIFYDYPMFEDLVVIDSLNIFKPNNLKLSWRKCLFEKAFKVYNVYCKNCDPKITFEIDDVNQTDVIIPYAPFGIELNFEIETQPILGNYNSFTYDRETYSITEQIEPFKEVLYNEKFNIVFELKQNSISAKVDDQEIAYCTIENIKYLILSDNYLYAYRTDKIIQLDLITLNIIEEFFPEDYIIGANYFSSPSISNNDIMIIELSETEYAGDMYIVIDLMNKIKIAEIESIDNYYRESDISDDGKIARVNADFYSIQQDSPIYISSMQNFNTYFTKLIGDNVLLNVVTSPSEPDKLEYLDVHSMAVKKEFQFENDFIFSKVKGTSKLLVFSGSFYNVFDYENMQESLPIYSKENCFVVGDYLYGDQGYRIKYEWKP